MQKIWSLGSFYYLTVCKAKQPEGRLQSPERPRPRRSLHGRPKGWDQIGEVAGECTMDTNLEGRTQGDPPGLGWSGTGAALPEWWERLVGPRDSNDSISGTF